MKNGRAIVLTRKLHGQTDDDRQTLWLQYPSCRGVKTIFLSLYSRVVIVPYLYTFPITLCMRCSVKNFQISSGHQIHCYTCSWSSITPQIITLSLRKNAFTELCSAFHSNLLSHMRGYECRGDWETYFDGFIKCLDRYTSPIHREVTEKAILIWYNDHTLSSEQKQFRTRERDAEIKRIIIRWLVHMYASL